MIEKNQVAPNFTLKDQFDKDVSLSDFLGSKVCLYFYPKDNTAGCSNQAMEFARLYEEFKSNNTIIIGISRDNLKSHQRFVEKYSLPFILLSDTNEVVCNLYNVLQEKNMYGKKSIGIVRSTFIIDELGVVKEALYKVNSKTNAINMCELIK